MMVKQFIERIKHTIKWHVFEGLDYLAKQGSTTAHRLACQFLPY